MSRPPIPADSRSARNRFSPCALAVALAAPLAGFAAPAAADPAWTRYRTGDDGLSIDLPRFLAAGPGTGVTAHTARFTDATGTVSIDLVSVPRKGDVDAYFANMAAQARAEGVAIDYRRQTRRFAVVSGMDATKVIYARCNVSPTGVACFNITYPAARLREFDPIVTRISLSLRAGDRVALAGE